MGARMKVQAKAKFDQISESPDATRRRGSGREAGGLESINRGELQLKIGCYGLAPVLKVSDDKIDYNRANFASLCCCRLL
jgi:hypothetical protein